MIRLRDRLHGILFAAGGAAALMAAAMDVWFMRTGSRTPDQKSGRIYAVQEHGTLYVSPLLAHVAAVLFFAGVTAMAVAAVLVLWRRLKLRVR